MEDIKAIEKLTSSISKAQSALVNTFGTLESVNFSAADYFDKDQLAEAYKAEDVFTDIAKRLSSFGKEIRSMRSSYLPAELFKTIDGTLDTSISDSLSELESYENAFMRMLGMPESDEISLASGGAESSTSAQEGSITYVGSNGSLIPGASAVDITENILDQRAKRRADRIVRVNNSIFNLDKKEKKRIDESSSLTEGEEAEDAVIYPNLMDFEKNPYLYSYLLFPPVKDSRFSKCINEPGKIVAPLFSNSKSRTINSNKIKPTLLESVIRIRIDRISGQNIQDLIQQEAESLSGDEPSLSLGSSDEEEIVPLAENYGLIESLFIIRLRSAISGLAKKFAKDRDQIVEAISRLGVEMDDKKDDDTTDDTGSTSNDAAVGRTEVEPDSDDDVNQAEKNHLQSQLLIEDSMMILLGDNSGAIDLQKNTQRNSSVLDAHLMSGLIGIVDIPRVRIKKRLSEIRKKRNDHFVSQAEPIRGNINAMIGTDIGIGNIDMLVFSLALFTISEKHLLGLLSDSEYDRLKQQTLGDALDSIANRSKDSRISAVNELTDLAYAGYQLFVKDIAG
jgi:hypothetical protein